MEAGYMKKNDIFFEYLAPENIQKIFILGRTVTGQCLGFFLLHLEIAYFGHFWAFFKLLTLPET